MKNALAFATMSAILFAFIAAYMLIGTLVSM